MDVYKKLILQHETPGHINLIARRLWNQLRLAGGALPKRREGMSDAERMQQVQEYYRNYTTMTAATKKRATATTIATKKRATATTAMTKNRRV